MNTVKTDANKKELIEKFIRLMNEAISAAVEHGGDPGGAYLTEPEKQKASVEALASFLGPEIGVREEDHVWLLTYAGE